MVLHDHGLAHHDDAATNLRNSIKMDHYTVGALFLPSCGMASNIRQSIEYRNEAKEEEIIGGGAILYAASWNMVDMMNDDDIKFTVCTALRTCAGRMNSWYIYVCTQGNKYFKIVE
jgi:hypothetical protein